MSSTKEKILLTSLELFSKSGFDAVSVKDISDKLNITKSALYKHYKNKRDIFDKIIERMEENDYKRAEEYNVPIETFEENPQNYKKTAIDDIITYTLAQFKYWTEDGFASTFRKMLIVEQYKNKQVAELYKQYLTSGPYNYIKDLFVQITGNKKKGESIALSFYSVFYFYIILYDSGEEREKLNIQLAKSLEKYRGMV